MDEVFKHISYFYLAILYILGYSFLIALALFIYFGTIYKLAKTNLIIVKAVLTSLIIFSTLGFMLFYSKLQCVLMSNEYTECLVYDDYNNKLLLYILSVFIAFYISANKEINSIKRVFFIIFLLFLLVTPLQIAILGISFEFNYLLIIIFVVTIELLIVFIILRLINKDNLLLRLVLLYIVKSIFLYSYYLRIPKFTYIFKHYSSVDMTLFIFFFETLSILLSFYISKWIFKKLCEERKSIPKYSNLLLVIYLSLPYIALKLFFYLVMLYF